MTPQSLLGLIALALVVTACDAGAVDAETGGTAAEAVLGPSSGNLPPFAPLYPQAEVTSTKKMGVDPKDGIVTFTAAATIDEVLAFYREHGAKHDLIVQVEQQQGSSQILGMEGRTNKDAGFQVTVGPLAGAAGKVRVTLAYLN